MKNKKLLAYIGFTALAINMAVAAVAFAQATPTGTQVINCSAGTAFAGGTPANFSFSTATVSASDQDTSANVPLNVLACNATASVQTVSVYALDFTSPNTYSIPVTSNLKVNAINNLTCSGTCNGTVTANPDSLALPYSFTAAGAGGSIDLYELPAYGTGTFLHATGVEFTLTIPGGKPAGTYTSTFTFSIA